MSAWAVSILLAPAAARADVISVTISSPGLASDASALAFDFIIGGAYGNQVTLSTLTSDGSVDSTSTTGDVTGSGPWVFGEGSFFNELLVFLDPTGSTLSFSIATTNNAPGSGLIPDSFSFYILATDLSPLVVTDEPLGTNALFQFDLGMGATGLRVFNAQATGFAMAVTLTPDSPVPEPSTLVLLAWLGTALVAKRRAGVSVLRV